MDAIPLHNIEEDNSATPRQAAPVLHIASLIAHVQPAKMGEVAVWLQAQPKVEIHSQDPQGKFAVVMESRHEKAVLDLLDALVERPGVLNAALIYHEIIDGEEDL